MTQSQRPENAMVVQFPHPGGECLPDGDHMPWNTGAHGRKFLTGTGDHVDADGRHDAVDLAFWAEWEPPSAVVTRWSPNGRLPQTLQLPFWTRPGAGVLRQNTDPWVFGDRMRYSNCRQTGPRPRRTPSAMQRLPTGSVIVFGSTLDGEFCVDTVFVVASSETWDPAQLNEHDIDAAFYVCTVEPLAVNTCASPRQLTMFHGATIDDPVEGMYSFVPARRVDIGEPRFSRPAVRMSQINPRCTQSTKGATESRPIDDVRGAWEQLRSQVLDQGVGLATRLDAPSERERSTSDTATTLSGNAGCQRPPSHEDVTCVTC